MATNILYQSGINEMILGLFPADGYTTFDALLIMNTSRIVAEPFFVQDLTYLGDLSASDLDEMDGAGYSRQAITLTSVGNGASNRIDVQVDVANTTWTGLGVGTSPMAGVLVIGLGGSDATSPLICFTSLTQEIDADGSNFSIFWSPENLFSLNMVPVES